jgi:hypothetical protein
MSAMGLHLGCLPAVAAREPSGVARCCELGLGADGALALAVAVRPALREIRALAARTVRVTTSNRSPALRQRSPNAVNLAPASARLEPPKAGGLAAAPASRRLSQRGVFMNKPQFVGHRQLGCVTLLLEQLEL